MKSCKKLCDFSTYIHLLKLVNIIVNYWLKEFM